MPKPTILYNGACPICRREIDHYQQIDRRDAHALDFLDISEPAPLLKQLNLTNAEAKRRLHVLDANGRLLVGIPAFAAIWDRLPRYRWLSSVVRLPILRWLLPWVYEPIAFCLFSSTRDACDERPHRRRLNRSAVERRSLQAGEV